MEGNKHKMRMLKFWRDEMGRRKKRKQRASDDPLSSFIFVNLCPHPWLLFPLNFYACLSVFYTRNLSLFLWALSVFSFFIFIFQACGQFLHRYLSRWWPYRLTYSLKSESKHLLPYSMSTLESAVEMLYVIESKHRSRTEQDWIEWNKLKYRLSKRNVRRK